MIRPLIKVSVSVTNIVREFIFFSLKSFLRGKNTNKMNSLALLDTKIWSDIDDKNVKYFSFFKENGKHPLNF